MNRVFRAPSHKHFFTPPNYRSAKRSWPLRLSDLHRLPGGKGPNRNPPRTLEIANFGPADGRPSQVGLKNKRNGLPSRPWGGNLLFFCLIIVKSLINYRIADCSDGCCGETVSVAQKPSSSSDCSGSATGGKTSSASGSTNGGPSFSSRGSSKSA